MSDLPRLLDPRSAWTDLYHSNGKSSTACVGPTSHRLYSSWAEPQYAGDVEPTTKGLHSSWANPQYELDVGPTPNGLQYTRDDGPTLYGLYSSSGNSQSHRTLVTQTHEPQPLSGPPDGLYGSLAETQSHYSTQTNQPSSAPLDRLYSSWSETPSHHNTPKPSTALMNSGLYSSDNRAPASHAHQHLYGPQKSIYNSHNYTSSNTHHNTYSPSNSLYSSFQSNNNTAIKRTQQHTNSQEKGMYSSWSEGVVQPHLPQLVSLDFNLAPLTHYTSPRHYRSLSPAQYRSLSPRSRPEAVAKIAQAQRLLRQESISASTLQIPGREHKMALAHKFPAHDLGWAGAQQGLGRADAVEKIAEVQELLRQHLRGQSGDGVVDYQVRLRMRILIFRWCCESARSKSALHS